jgi:hypothetical protein
LEGENPYWTFLGKSDGCKLPVICQVIDFMKKDRIIFKNYKEFAFDLNEMAYY